MPCPPVPKTSWHFCNYTFFPQCRAAQKLLTNRGVALFFPACQRTGLRCGWDAFFLPTKNIWWTRQALWGIWVLWRCSWDLHAKCRGVMIGHQSRHSTAVESRALEEPGDITYCHLHQQGRPFQSRDRNTDFVFQLPRLPPGTRQRCKSNTFFKVLSKQNKTNHNWASLYLIVYEYIWPHQCFLSFPLARTITCLIVKNKGLHKRKSHVVKTACSFGMQNYASCN